MPLAHQKYNLVKTFPLPDCHHCILKFVYYDLQQFQCLDADYIGWHWLQCSDIKRIKHIIHKWAVESFCGCKQRKKKTEEDGGGGAAAAADEQELKIVKKDISDPTLNFAQFCEQHNFDLNHEILTKMWNWSFNKVIISKDVLQWLSIRRLPIRYHAYALPIDENGTLAMDTHIFEEMIMQLKGPNCKKIRKMFSLLKEIIYLYLEYDKARNVQN